MKIDKDEVEIIGNWIFKNPKMIADDQCKRIDWLRANYLIQIATDESGWLKLYQDPEDKRYWQLDFRFGEMQAGGPPSLIWLPEPEARFKFKF